MMISHVERTLFSTESKGTVHTQSKDQHSPTRKDWANNI